MRRLELITKCQVISKTKKSSQVQPAMQRVERDTEKPQHHLSHKDIKSKEHNRQCHERIIERKDWSEGVKN